MSIVSTWSLRCVLTLAILGELASVHDARAAGRQDGGRPSRQVVDGVRPVARPALADGDDFEASWVAAALLASDPRVREEAVRRLPGRHFDTELPLVQQALADADARVRLAAVDALADLGPGATAVASAVALGDVDAAVRERAVYVLGRFGGTLAIGGLFDALADPDDSVREAAAGLLTELEPSATAGPGGGDRHSPPAPRARRPGRDGHREGFR